MSQWFELRPLKQTIMCSNSGSVPHRYISLHVPLLGIGFNPKKSPLKPSSHASLLHCGKLVVEYNFGYEFRKTECCVVVVVVVVVVIVFVVVVVVAIVIFVVVVVVVA